MTCAPSNSPPPRTPSSYANDFPTNDANHSHEGRNTHRTVNNEGYNATLIGGGVMPVAGASDTRALARGKSVTSIVQGLYQSVDTRQ